MIRTNKECSRNEALTWNICNPQPWTQHSMNDITKGAWNRWNIPDGWLNSEIVLILTRRVPVDREIISVYDVFEILDHTINFSSFYSKVLTNKDTRRIHGRGT